jgi:hypothetical protein
MTTPRKTPFATRRFVPWAASPFLVLFMLLLPLVIDQWTIGRVCGVAGVWLICGAEAVLPIRLRPVMPMAPRAHGVVRTRAAGTTGRFRSSV